MIVNPLANIIMIIGMICLYCLISALPGLLPFIGGSGYAFVIMRSTYYAFMKVKRRQEAIVGRGIGSSGKNQPERI
jgi:uncharacterized membrane protein YesL